MRYIYVYIITMCNIFNPVARRKVGNVLAVIVDYIPPVFRGRELFSAQCHNPHLVPDFR